MTFEIREATRDDAALIMSFIDKMAAYEKLTDEVVNDAATIEEWVFDKGAAEVLFAMEDDVEVGFAVFCKNYSTFVGRAGLYLEDIYIDEEHRGKGYGKALFSHCAQIAVERGYGRMEWVCLDWNQPSIDFYLSMDARPMDEWTTYRLSGETLAAAARA